MSGEEKPINVEDSQLSGYRVELESFQGPLDLLLHLIEREELDITKVALAQVTNQYLTYMAILKEINVDATQLNDYDKESAVKVMMKLFNYSCEEKKWSEALDAALCVQKIGAKYLNDEELGSDNLTVTVNNVAPDIIEINGTTDPVPLGESLQNDVMKHSPENRELFDL